MVLRCRLLWTGCFASLLAITLSPLTRAAELTVLPTSLGLPPGSAETSTQSIFFRPTPSGSLKLDAVDIEYIAGPDDTRLDAGAAKIVNFTPGASGSTIAVGVALTRSAFLRPGTYKIALRMKGARTEAQPVQPGAQPPAPTPVDEFIELTLTRAPAQITVNIASDSRVVIDRGFPWKKGRLNVTFSLSQDSGPEAGPVTFNASAVVRIADKELVPGKLAIAPLEIKLANGAGSGTLAFTDFGRAGDFQSSLTLASPSLAKAMVVPIAIRVRDNWVLPLVVILAGVFAGAAVNLLVRIWRPRQVSAYRITQLQARLEARAPAIGTEASRNEYDRLLARLQVLADGIDIDLTTDTAIEQLATDIKALEDKLTKADADADGAIKQQQKALDKAKEALAPHLPAAKLEELQPIQMGIDDCRERHLQGYAEEALERIDAVKDKLAATRTRLARAALDAMTQEIATEITENAKKKVLNDKVQAAVAALAQPSAEIGQLLADIRQAINAEKGVPQGDVVAGGPAPVIQRAIAVSSEDRRVGERLLFRIEPAPDQPVIAVRWTFENGRVTSGTSPRTARIYPVAGSFTVRAEIEYQDPATAPEDVAPLRLTILPSETQHLAQRIADHIRRVDWGIVALSVVVAAVSGLLDRYADKPFGTVTDYCWAFLWGFGIDSVVRGFSATFTRLNTKS
jgi:hypothetical protein